MPYVYLGSASGPLILRYGEGFQLIQSDGSSVVYKPRVELWALEPAGAMGDVTFRSVDVKLRHTLGYSVTITPIVDGIEQAIQTFSAGPPSGARLEDYAQLQAAVAKRGTNIAAIIELDSTYGEQEIVQVAASGMPLRQIP